MVRRSLVALTGVLALTVTACGTASEHSAPTGVDELVVPTPSVDPADFVDRVDNPWLPLAPGGTWTYRVSGDDAAGTMTVTVRSGTEAVDGVEATVVDRTAPDGTVTTDFYAQDREGNVWWLGRDGAWRAGEDGAEAGLAMPAAPRRGDGWREAYAEGVAEDTATVLVLDGNATTPVGTFGDLVVIEVRSELDPGSSRRDYYAQGAGLVLEVATGATPYDAALVSAPGAEAGS